MFPLHIFLILEKMNVLLWNSKSLTPNSYVCLLNAKWFYVLNLVLRNEVSLNSAFLVENTGIDVRFFNSMSKTLSAYFTTKKLILSYQYYFLTLKLKISFLVLPSESSKPYLYSIDKLFQNANWLERETSEMYGVLYYFKSDMRKLLLDYSKLDNPMLRDFASEGIQDVFFNFFENQVTVSQNEVVEL